MGGGKGTLTVISGPMFSNKSGELLRLATVHRIADRSVTLFKHSLDNRYTGVDSISTHGGASMAAEPVSTSSEVSLLAASADVVAIDEAQFFDEGLARVAAQLVDSGVTVFVAGLDRNFKGEPFGPMPALMAMADEVMKLKAVCMRCRSLNGTMTQRLIDGRAASRNSPVILVGAAEAYEARCRDCHELAE
ncbi:MAG TPA: thymidine kinase [Candidatus Dormibacteraeota bacterium]